MSRILFLVSSMEGGGAERVAALLCNHWAARGHEVTLMPTFAGRGECLYSLDARVQVDYLADRVGSSSRSVFNKARRYRVLRCAIRALAPDGIVSFLPHVNVAAVLAAWGMKVPVVVSERTFPPAMPLGRGLETLRRFAYPRAKGVVVQTERTRRWLADCCPRAAGWVIPNPVVCPLPNAEPSVAPHSVVDTARRIVVGVGRLSEEKGFGRLLAAFGELAHRFPGWELVLLGEGQERQRLEAQAESLGLSDRVHLPGRVGNLGDWYARADLFVMSSRFEGFPNALVEAMAHGLPAVSVDCETGPADIIREGVDGYLVSPSEGTAGLARAMEGLMQNDDRRRRMGEAAVAVRERFSPERVMAEWDEVLGLWEEDRRV
jgi:glycosyltransferase involved in cell wall biosynthesis